jgi:hypothetical protein
MWLYARKMHCPYYPHNPKKGFVRKVDIDSDKYYDFMIYNEKLKIIDLLRYRLVFIGAATV